MAQYVIDDTHAFNEFLSEQPLIQWAAKKESDIASGIIPPKGIIKEEPKKSGPDEDLLAALSSMA